MNQSIRSKHSRLTRKTNSVKSHSVSKNNPIKTEIKQAQILQETPVVLNIDILSKKRYQRNGHSNILIPGSET